MIQLLTIWVIFLYSSLHVKEGSSTASPSLKPSLKPTSNPSTINPSSNPSTISPSIIPSTAKPSTNRPTVIPSTITPTSFPSTAIPTTASPTVKPSTSVPSSRPSTLSPSLNPTVVATASPTSSVVISEGTCIPVPIAKHQLVIVPSAGSALIRLQSYDCVTNKLTYTVSSIPSSGSLYQLSQVYSDYGYEPKNGKLISSGNVVVTGSNNRVFYLRPSPDASKCQKWDSFDFTVTDPAGVTSYPGTVTIAPPSGCIVSSDFLLSNEMWTIEGNKAASYNSTFEPYSRGKLLNRYILATDDKINVQKSGESDKSLWYFVAPSNFLGNLGISYGGTLQFTLSSFSGDFTKLNDLQNFVVLMECATCTGPVGKGITLGYSLASLAQSPNGQFKGEPLRVSIPLLETKTGGWVKDPQNTLLSWYPASQCDVIQVLSRLSKLSILGDYTTWYETVALDDVQIANTKGQLPLCAQERPDASTCSCS